LQKSTLNNFRPVFSVLLAIAVAYGGENEPAKKSGDRILPPEAKLGLDELKPAVSAPGNFEREIKSPREAVEALAEAEKLKNAGNHEGVIEKCAAALKYDPENPEAHRLSAIAHVSIGSLGKGLQHLRKAMKFIGNDISMQILMGRLCMANRQPKESMLHYRKAMLCADAGREPAKHGEALIRLGELLGLLGYTTASLECYNRFEEKAAVHGREMAELKYLRNLVLQPELLMKKQGILLLQLGRNEEALKKLSGAWKRNRSARDTAGYYFDALVANNKFQQAEKLFLDVAGRESYSNIIRSMAHKLCVESKDVESPVRIWEKYLQCCDVSETVATALARAAIDLGEKKGARKILDRLLVEIPGSNEAVEILAGLSVESGDYRLAIEYLVELVSRHPSSAEGIRSEIKKIISGDVSQKMCVEFSRQAYKNTDDKRFARHYVAGLLWSAFGKHLKAADHYKRAIEANRDFLPAYSAFLDQQQYLEGAEDKKVVEELLKEISAGHHLYHYLRGKILRGNWEFEEAVREFSQARNKTPDHIPTLLELAEVLMIESKYTGYPPDLYKKITDILSDAVTMDRFNLRVHELIIEAYSSRNQREQLAEEASRLERTMPDKPKARMLAAEAWLKAGEKEKAMKIIRELEEKGEKFPGMRYLPVLIDTGGPNMVISRKKFEKFRQQLESILEEYPDYLEAWKLLAAMWQKPGATDYGKSAALWKKMREREPGNVVFTLGYLAAIRKAKQHYLLLEEATRISEKISNRTNTWFGSLLGRIQVETLVDAGRVDEALDMAKALDLKAGDSSKWKRLFLEICREHKKHGRALKMLQSMGGNDNALIAIDDMKVTFLCAAGDFDKAIEAADGIQAARTKFFTKCVIAGRMTDAGEYEKALELVGDLEQETGVFSDSDLERVQIALLQLKAEALAGSSTQEGLKKAEESVETFLNSYPSMKLKTVEILKLLYMKTKAFEEGAAVFNRWAGKALESDKVDEPLLEETRTSQSLMLMWGGKLKEARSVLEKAIEKLPRSAKLQNVLANILGELGREKEALAALEKACELEPENSRNSAEYCNNLAYFLSEMNTKIGEAEKLARKALASALLRSGYQPVAFRDTLAWVFYKAGKLEESATQFADFLKLPEKTSGEDREKSYEDPSFHPVLWDHAGDVFYRLGWNRQSEEYWQYALKFAEEKKQHEKTLSREIREILQKTPGKLKSVRAGEQVNTAPLAVEVDGENR